MAAGTTEDPPPASSGGGSDAARTLGRTISGMGTAATAATKTGGVQVHGHGKPDRDDFSGDDEGGGDGDEEENEHGQVCGAQSSTHSVRRIFCTGIVFLNKIFPAVF